MARGIDPAMRQDLLGRSRGTGEAFLDLRGSRYLPPVQKHLVDSRPRSERTFEVEKPKDDPDALPPWWWNPGNPLAASLPASVSFHSFQKTRTALQRIDKNLDLGWNAAARVWQLWYYKPGFTEKSPWTNGWVHIKDFKIWQGTPYILKVVKAMDSEAVGSVKDRYRRIQAKRQADLERMRKARFEMYRDRAGEAYDYTTISTAGSGDKFCRFHA